jgi:hypothetical protein
VQTNTQKVTHVPVVSVAAKTVTPKSGPTITRPSQQKVCRPGQACHTLSVGGKGCDAMCSGIESNSALTCCATAINGRGVTGLARIRAAASRQTPEDVAEPVVLGFVLHG